MKQSYNIQEVAEFFSVSRRTIERAIKSGELHAFKIRDARRIAAEELDRLKKSEKRLQNEK